MNRKVPSPVILIVGLIVLCVIGNACTGTQVAHPASALQHALALKLANTEDCAVGNSATLQQLVNANNADGIVSLAEGCYQVTTTINITPCTQLLGAGADKTILYRDPHGNYSGPIIKVFGKDDTQCVTQISGLALIGVRDTDDTGQDYGLVISTLTNFRVDHSYFEGFGSAGVRVEGSSSGVIDHAVFVDNYKRGIDNLGYGVVVYGKGTWDNDLEPGAAQATFVEDSLFVGNRHAIAASAGAHYVFRSNQVLHGVVACAVDAHGMGYGSAHGTQFVEIYRNVIEDPVYDECGIGLRGGAGVIFENTIQGYKNPILLILEWGTPDIYKTDYPVLDQIHDLYIWDNQVMGGSADPQVDETGVGFIQVGRDFFTQPMPGYVPFDYPHPLASGGPFDDDPFPPGGE